MSENIVPKSLEDRLTYQINLLSQQIEQMKANQRPSDSLTYVLSGIATIPAVTMTGLSNSYQSSIVVPHNLGYAPVLLAFGILGSQRADLGSPALNYIISFSGSTIIEKQAWAYTDETNLYLIQGISVAGTFSGVTGVSLLALPVRYYLMREPIS